MAVFHHYAFAEGPDRPARRSPKTCGSSVCRPAARCRAGHHREPVAATRSRSPRRSASCLTPEWLTAALSSRFPGGAGHRRHPGPDRRAGVDERPVPDRVRARGPARALADPVCEGVLLRARTRERAGGRARGVLLPRPRRRHRRAHAQGRVGRRGSGDAARRRDHRGRDRGRRRVLRRLDPVHGRADRGPPGGAAPTARVRVGESRGRERAVARAPDRPDRRRCAGSRRSATTSTARRASACPTTCEIRSSSSTRSTHSAPTTRCGVDRHPR